MWNEGSRSCSFCSIFGCATCASSTVCATCSATYVKIGDICIQCNSSLNCNCAVTHNVCSSCLATGYTISATSGVGCVACPSSLNCARCDTANQCASCNSGYSMNPTGSTGCCLTDYTWSNSQLTCIACPANYNCFRC